MAATPQESVTQSFLAIVAHLTEAGATHGAARKRKDPQTRKAARPARKHSESAHDDEGGEELLAQLSGSAAPAGKRRTDTAKRANEPTGFNPFGNAALPRRK
jgi:hypothetical protein